MKKINIILVLAAALFAACSNNNSSNKKTAANDPDSLTGKSSYVNPVDGKTYTTEGKFEEYKPDGGVKKAEGPVQSVQIILLTDQNKIEAAVGVDNLADYIKSVDVVVMEELKTTKDSGRILFQFALYDDKDPAIDLSYDGPFTRQTLEKVLNKVKDHSNGYRIKKDSCVFQNQYAINAK